MKIIIQLDDSDDAALKRSTTSLKKVCEIFHIHLKGGILHYPGDFEAYFAEDDYTAYLQINALQAYCVLNQIPTRMAE